MASRELWFRFAHKLFLNNQDASEALCNLWQLGDSLRIDRRTVQEVADQLKREGLLEYLSFEGDISLTSFGTAAVMQALAEGDQATFYFPPAHSIIPPNTGADRHSITTKSVNEFIDDLTEQAEKTILDDHEQLALETGILLLEKYIESGASQPEHLRAGLEKVYTLLSADSEL